VAVGVEQVALAVAFEDFTKQPAMPVKVCKLCVAKQCVEGGGSRIFQKVEVGPQTTKARAFRIAIEFLLLFILTGIVLRRGIHLRTVALVVPPGEAEIARDHVCAGMHVTNHALRRRNLARELVLDRMSGFSLLNRSVGGL